MMAVPLSWHVGGGQTTSSACGLSDADRRWIQRGLDSWHRLSRESLRLEPAPLPWMVLFDTSCVWHLAPDDQLPVGAVPITASLSFAGQPVTVRAMPHRGTVRLPDGKDIPAQPVAVASVYREGAAAFFTMAMPDVWRRDPRYARDPDLDRFFLGVMAHEMVHTRHLVAIVEQAKELARRYALSDLQLDDDVIQKRFERVRRFRRAFEAERDLFFRAAAESDAAKRRALTAKALSMARQRRTR